MRKRRCRRSQPVRSARHRHGVWPSAPPGRCHRKRNGPIGWRGIAAGRSPSDDRSVSRGERAASDEDIDGPRSRQIRENGPGLSRSVGPSRPCGRPSRFRRAPSVVPAHGRNAHLYRRPGRTGKFDFVRREAMTAAPADRRSCDDPSAAAPAHHPLIAAIAPWRGWLRPGEFTNWLGVRSGAAMWLDGTGPTLRDHWRHLRPYYRWRYADDSRPDFNEEYIEWVALAEAVAAAHKHFVMIELGAGWGRWLLNAGALARLRGDLTFQLVGVEAEPRHY